MREALRVERLSRAFGALRALNDVSFEVEQGERRAIIGPNGAGKTTLFNLVAGEVTATSGQVFLHGREISRLPAFRRCEIGLARTYQRNNLFVGLSTRENVSLAVRRRLGAASQPFHSAERLPAVADETQGILERFGLEARADLPVRALGYGEQRRLEVALAVASGPSVLLLDEPTAGMSPSETAHMTALIRELPRSITVLIIEHDMDVVFALADRISVLHFGELLAEGPPREVRANPAVQEAYLGGAAEAAPVHV